jgi:hypothetical protein
LFFFSFLVILFCFVFCGGGTGVKTHSPVLARQVLCHLSHASSPFCFSNISDRVSCFTQVSLHHNLQAHHPAQLIG